MRLPERTFPKQPGWLRWLLVALAGLVFAVLLAYLFVYLRYAVALIQFPFDYDQGEGFELNDTLLFSRGEWPYRSNEVYPYYSSNYPPLYHLVLVPFMWVFGPAYWYGRLFSFLATLVTAALIGAAVHREGRVPWIAAAAGLLYLSSNYVYHVGPLFRQHISMVMLETAAIYLLWPLKHENDPDADPKAERWRLIWVLVLLMAAGYTKQLAYITAIVAFLFILTKGWKRAFISGAIFGAVGVAFFLLIDVGTGGEWWLNTIVANVNPFVPGQMQELFAQWFGLHLVVTLLAGAWVLYDGWRSRRVSLYSLWFIGAVANSTLAGKWGAGESYFMTAIAASLILAGLALSELHNRATSDDGPQPAFRAAMLLAIPLLLLWQTSLTVHMPTQGRLFGPVAQVLGLPTDQPYYDSQGYTQLGRPPNSIDVAQGYKILSYVQAVDGPVMTEEAAFSLLAGKAQVGNPTQLLNLDRSGLLNYAPLVADIEARRFDLIILKAEFYPRPVLRAIGQHYDSIATEPMNGFLYRILVPRE